MGVVIGWDIGGAHLKAARVKSGRVEEVVQAATPLWLGLDSLEAAFDAVHAQLGARRSSRDYHDWRTLRRFRLAPRGCHGSGHDRGKSSRSFGPEHLRRPRRLHRARRSRSARRRHRLSQLACERRAHRASSFEKRCSSTSARQQPISFQLSPAGSRQSVTATAERLASGELVYTGMTRSFVMALASRAPFRGAWTPLMNEYFASSADIHRILDDLPYGADKMPTADGREKTVDASRARLARMIGREADEAAALEWKGLAAWFAEEQIRQIADAAWLRLSRNDVAVAAPIDRGRRRGGRRGGGRAPTGAVLCRLFRADRGPRGGLALRARGCGRVAWREPASASVGSEVVVRQSRGRESRSCA